MRYFSVPPLENFVMNRVLGDYMETMLYKIFVSIDEETTVSEVSVKLLLRLFELFFKYYWSPFVIGFF